MSGYEKINETIRKELIDKGLIKTFVNYEQFLKLYTPYKNKVSEKDFAAIIDITPVMYRKIKWDLNARAGILKTMQIDKKIKAAIITMVKEKGFRNKLITYEEFLELYAPYKKQMKERNFADILEVDYSRYRYLRKNPNARVRILKDEQIEEELEKKIVEDLKNSGYVNKSIDYVEFLKLYYSYKTQVTEKEFAHIIGLTDPMYDTIKNRSNRRATMLRTGIVTEELKEKVRQDLREKGYSNKLIDYEEFLNLFSTYKNQLSELDFAKILNVSPNTYSKLKTGKSKAIVLKSGTVSKELKERIVDQLIALGYQGKKITYEEFLSMYEQFKTEMTENDFASVLNISSGAYRGLKYSGHRAIILKKKILNEEKIEKMRNSMIKEGYANKLITYEEFVLLYNTYGKEITETEFAQVINLTFYGLSNLKKNKGKARILETQGITEELKENIINSLKEEGYINGLIDYEEFCKLYEPYKDEMTERDFAEILGLKYNSLNNIRKNNGKARILETHRITEEVNETIINSLKEEGYTNSIIDYEEFCKLYGPYKDEMTERDFAEIIGISYKSYYGLKYNSQKAQILKTRKIDSKRIEEIRNVLKEQGYTNKKISYEEFRKLYEPYEKEMTESEFFVVLGISYGGFSYMKYQGQTSTVLKNTREDIQLIMKQIINDLMNECNNQFIDYNQFLKLYEQYKENVTKKEFAEILGINYSHIRYRGSNARINFNKKLLDRAKYQIKLEEREYSKAELEQICSQNGITLYELLCDLQNVYINNRYEIVDELMKKDSIYIGRCPIPSEFQEKYAEEILQKAQYFSKTMGKSYRLSRFREDFASEVLIYILQNKGDIVKNSNNDEEALDSIYAYMHQLLKYKYIQQLSIKLPVSLDEHINVNSKGNGRERYSIIKDKGKTFKKPESVVEDFEKNDSDIISEMGILYEYGMTNVEVMSFIMKKYRIEKEELLRILEEELSNKRKIVKTENGQVYLGEEYG